MTTVQLFITCLVDSFYPETGEAILSILRRLGLTVDFHPDQTCCGQPPFNAGLRTEARPIVEHTIRVFEKTNGDIVIPSGSCAHMIKHGYPELFQDDPGWLPRAHALGNRVYEFTEYLVDRLGVTDLGARWEGTLTYHPSCHTLRGMHIDRQPRTLLEFWRGRAELGAGNDAAAATHFERVVSSGYGHLFSQIEYVRSLYYLGQIAERKGDSAKARENYRKFVSYWKDGDIDRDKATEASKKIN